MSHTLTAFIYPGGNDFWRICPFCTEYPRAVGILNLCFLLHKNKTEQNKNKNKNNKKKRKKKKEQENNSRRPTETQFLMRNIQASALLSLLSYMNTRATIRHVKKFILLDAIIIIINELLLMTSWLRYHEKQGGVLAFPMLVQ